MKKGWSPTQANGKKGCGVDSQIKIAKTTRNDSSANIITIALL
jgi:hypothetical protein